MLCECVLSTGVTLLCLGASPVTVTDKWENQIPNVKFQVLGISDSLFIHRVLPSSTPLRNFMHFMATSLAHSTPYTRSLIHLRARPTHKHSSKPIQRYAVLMPGHHNLH